MKISMPTNVKKIISVLEDHGFEAYAVGGCVRDSMLDRNPHDWDITTSALPAQVKSLFKKTIDTGIVHGTVTILLDGVGYEVTTYRMDGEYEDSRHPKEVTFTPELAEDLKRRDFTINAMAYNDRRGLIDLFGGADDLEHHVIRCVGDPLERFSEDALRIFRAVRFSAQLGFQIHPDTRKAITVLAPNLKRISVERTQAELTKLVTSDHPEEFRAAYETGITREVLPEFDRAMDTEQNNPNHKYTVGDHLIASMNFVPPKKHLRLAMLFHDIGKPLVKSTDEEGIDHFYGHGDVSAQLAGEILKRLRFDNDTIYRVTSLIRFHDYRPDLNARAVRRFMNKTGTELLEDVFTVQTGDVLSQSDYRREEKLNQIREVRTLAEEILEKKQCFSMKDLAVSGKDLMEDGMKPGKDMGRVLEELLREVIREPEHNTKEFLIEYSREFRES